MPYAVFAALALLLLTAAAPARADVEPSGTPSERLSKSRSEDLSKSFAMRLSEAAIERTKARVRYDGAYRRIAYPGGDVPAHLGVCTDVVIRAYRALGIDLQVLVHRDMKRAFARYPKAWGLKRPDPNIDHRRVLNLERFFERQGAALPASDDPADYRPGDLVTYRLPGGLPHVGVVTHRKGWSGRPLVAHNIGLGPQLEDVLFAYRIVGHYRFHPQP